MTKIQNNRTLKNARMMRVNGATVYQLRMNWHAVSRGGQVEEIQHHGESVSVLLSPVFIKLVLLNNE
jgi:hypothetical protein